MANLTKKEVDTLVERQGQLASDRSTFESHWQAAANLVRPDITFTGTKTPGQQNNQRIYDTTAINAGNDLAAAADFNLTNTSTRWFEAMPGDPGYDWENDEEARAWGWEATDRALRYFASPESGYAVANHEFYKDYFDFGTGVTVSMVVDGLLRFQARSLVSIYVNQSDDGRIVGVNRTTKMSINEIAERFGVASLPPELHRTWKSGSGHEKVGVLHCVWKRDKTDPMKIGRTNKPWASAYLLSEHSHCLDYGGFDENPYTVARLNKLPEEPYGRGMAMLALPSIRAINSLARDTLMATELSVAPPIMAHAGSIDGKLITTPRSIIWLKQGTREMPQPFQSGANVAVGEAEIERHAKRIEALYMTDRFRLPENDRMTAAEIHARQEYNLMATSPVTARLAAEKLDVDITRVFGWMHRTGRLPAWTGRRPFSTLKISYTSPFFAARQSSEANAWQAVLTDLGPVASVDPKVLDNFDMDKVSRAVARWRHLDPRVMRDSAEVEGMRTQQAQTQNAANIAGILGPGAAAAKDLASARQISAGL